MIHSDPMAMTQSQQDLCFGLSRLDGKQRTSRTDFVRQFPSALKQGQLAAALLEAATREQVADDVEAALIVGYTFGFPPEVEPLLWELICSDWHFRQEDIILLLQREFPNPAAIPYLKAAIDLKGRLHHLDYDDYGAYYKKCFHALRAIGTIEAIEVIRSYAESTDTALRTQAQYRMRRL